MCGVPVHSHESYLARLIKKALRSRCVSKQKTGGRQKRGGAKAVVQRAVVRTITPGTLTEDTLLESRRNNYLAALAEAEGFGLAWLDMSTSEFQLQPVSRPHYLPPLPGSNPVSFWCLTRLPDGKTYATRCNPGRRRRRSYRPAVLTAPMAAPDCELFSA